MALEAEVVGLVFLLHVLNCASSFDAANCEAAGVCEAADDSCLPLQRTLKALVERPRVVQVDDVAPSVCCADNEELVADVHSVDAILTRY